MGGVDQALASQLRNLQDRSGRSLDELYGVLRHSGLTKHGELRDLLKTKLGMGHGDANTLVHTYLKAGSGDAAPGETDPADEIYAGPKAALRPIHERLMAGIERLGAFEVATKKGYVSLRRKKQFAMIGPGTKARVDIGLNLKGIEATERLRMMPPGGMCQFKVEVTDASDIDAELIGMGAQGVRRGGLIEGGGMQRLQRWFVVGVAALAVSAALAQTFPSRPVTLIVPWPAGGSTDQVMRALATATEKYLGQTIIIENKAGRGRHARRARRW